MAANGSKIVTLDGLTTFKNRMNASIRSVVDASAGIIKDDVVSEIMDAGEFNERVSEAVQTEMATTEFTEKLTEAVQGAIAEENLVTDAEIDALFSDYDVGIDYTVATDAESGIVTLTILSTGGLVGETALMVGYTKTDDTVVPPSEVAVTEGKCELGTDIVVDSITVTKVAASGGEPEPGGDAGEGEGGA